jgi:L-lactate dehydrogenase complex protein LldG
MSTSKEQILAAISRNRPPTVDLPPLDRPWTEYADPRRQLAEVMEAVGGLVIAVRDVAELNEQLAGLPAYAEARNVLSLVPGIGQSNVDLSAATSPHDLKDLDFAILPGEFAVAENGAVWVTDEGLPHRAVYFLTQHLVLVVPADQVVDNMHAAYARLDGNPRQVAAAVHSRPISPQASRRGDLGREPGFGVFISGPSKTADIEQSLVIGAHGPRSLTVFLLAAASQDNTR